MKEFLKQHRYNNWNTEKLDYGTKDMFQKRMDILPEYVDYPLCICNDKILINVDWFECSFPNHPGMRSAEISLVHENKDGDWCDLKIYSLKEEDIKYNLEKYERKLMDLWKVFYGEDK